MSNDAIMTTPRVIALVDDRKIPSKIPVAVFSKAKIDSMEQYIRMLCNLPRSYFILHLMKCSFLLPRIGAKLPMESL